MMANSLVYGLVLVCMITGTTGSFMVTGRFDFALVSSLLIV